MPVVVYKFQKYIWLYMELKLRNWILVEDILLCLKYIIKMKLNTYSDTTIFLFYYLYYWQTSVSLNEPSSGQYLQKLKNAGAYSIRCCKYWPDDGLLRPKLVANNRNNKIKR